MTGEGSRFILKPQTLSEEDEQADLIFQIERHLHLYPALEWLYHIPNGGSRAGFYYTGWDGKRRRVSPEGRRLKAQGVRPGVPDLFLPEARGGYFGLYIEMKRAKEGTVSPEQKRWIAYLRERGYRVEICKGCLAAWNVLIWYIGLPPTQATGGE